MDADIFHNIAWSTYKATIFSELHKKAKASHLSIGFCHIAETERSRLAISAVDRLRHDYPHRVLFSGAYEDTSFWQRAYCLLLEILKSDSKVIVLPGYHLIEYWLMLIVAKLKGRRVAVFCDSTGRDRNTSRLKSIAKRIFFVCCDGYFAYGKRSKDYLISHGATAATIFQDCQAAALPATYSAKDIHANRLAALRDANGGRFRLLYVGRLAPEKRVDLLLLSVARLRSHGIDVDVRVVGAGPEGKLLFRLAVELGIQEHVSFEGSCTSAGLASYYESSHALVLPSDSEPWGLVVNEALSYGCPAIVSDVCGCIPELIEEGEAGFSFTAGSVEDLVRKTIKLQHDYDIDFWFARCTKTILKYSPERAASNILAGCMRLRAM